MSDSTTAAVEQWTASELGVPRLRLIPPLADEFAVYGAQDATERATAWALDHHYVLCEGIPRCAHGLYLMDMCPALACRTVCPQFDHANIWAPADDPLSPFGDGRPFILSAPYSKAISAETTAYAEAHGLDAGSFPEFGDGWYYPGSAMPLRLTPHGNSFWPIERDIAALLRAWPVRWPGED